MTSAAGAAASIGGGLRDREVRSVAGQAHDALPRGPALVGGEAGLLGGLAVGGEGVGVAADHPQDLALAHQRVGTLGAGLREAGGAIVRDGRVVEAAEAQRRQGASCIAAL